MPSMLQHQNKSPLLYLFTPFYFQFAEHLELKAPPFAQEPSLTWTPPPTTTTTTTCKHPSAPTSRPEGALPLYCGPGSSGRGSSVNRRSCLLSLMLLFL